MCLNDGIRWATHDFQNECKHANDDFYARLNREDEMREEQKQRDEGDEVEEGEIEEESELSNEATTLQSLQSWLKDKIKTIKKPSVSRVFNILRQFKKNKNLFDPQIDDGYLEYIFNNGKTIEIKSPFYVTDESKIITKSVMIMYE